MPAALEIAAALGVAAAVTWLITPPVRRLALRTSLLDHPVGYKQHRRATPYLGGLAVICGFLAGATPFGGAFSDFAPITLCALGLWAVGTLDDRVGLGIAIRLTSQFAAALVIWDWGGGWGFSNDAADLTLTILWVVGITNAFNLMDNLDGATGTVGAVGAAGVAAVAISTDNTVLAAFSVALAGACAGFLPHNLAKPSRIFLGDGGSMPIGFLLAATVMLCPHESLGWTAILASAPLVGLAIFDTTLVVMSRRRRGVAVLSGGRDHLTHRLLASLGSERSVCLVLAGAQALLCLLALGLHELSQGWVIAVSAIYLAVGAGALAFFEGLSLGRVPEERPT